MKRISYLLIAVSALFFVACTSATKQTKVENPLTHVKHLEWSRNAVVYEVNIRQYTSEGTFKAFEAHLPRLKELGVDVLWFMPIYPISEHNRKGTLGSYYAIKDYKAVNPEFGTLDDFKSLVKKSHDMGFKVLIDWVANHTGGDNVWLESNPEWFVRDEAGNFTSPYDWTDTYKLNYENKGMRAAMKDALKYWVQECDIDGYRCDVAYEVPTDFWNEARKELDAIKPVFMLAEAEHASLTLNAFDMVYNWPLKDFMNRIAKGESADNAQYTHEMLGITIAGRSLRAQDLDLLFAKQDSLFPRDVYQMNQITNHDLNSWEGTEFERLGEGVKAFSVLTYTINGIPLLYTGQETGMNRALEFFEKDTPPDWNSGSEWFAFFQKLNELKHCEPALAAGIEGGEMIRFQTKSPDIYAFARRKGASEVVVLLNLSASAQQLEYVGDMPAGEYTNYFTQVKEALPSSLQAWEYRVYVKR